MHISTAEINREVMKSTLLTIWVSTMKKVNKIMLFCHDVVRLRGNSRASNPWSFGVAVAGETELLNHHSVA